MLMYFADGEYFFLRCSCRHMSFCIERSCLPFSPPFLTIFQIEARRPLHDSLLLPSPATEEPISPFIECPVFLSTSLPL